MKSFVILLIAFVLYTFAISEPVSARPKTLAKKEIPAVEKLDFAPNLFKSDKLFFSGQPSLETLEWLEKQGVDLVINLRSDAENEDFTAASFNENEQVLKLGMKYISIPIDGYNSYTTENVAKFAKALDSKHKKALIHCASCGRVSYFMMAYLVDYKNYKLADAVEFGTQLKFTFPLEYLLKDEINWQLKK
ncbi:sulfur transferase domain-containing protein [uncultured Draconibacterium sp.]|uniref:fused DSP-PTPase phosphatase/NAD kinase-like protein n=1 Tax=uncultured Draconibacterium sp. TaxID=1573823 RepID=UPI003216F09F